MATTGTEQKLELVPAEPSERPPSTTTASTKKPATSRKGETFLQKAKRDKRWWAAVAVPVGLALAVVIGVVIYFTVIANKENPNTPRFQGFAVKTGTFCKSVRYRYQLPNSQYSPYSQAVGGADVTGTMPVFSAPGNAHSATVVWQRSVENTNPVTIAMTRTSQRLWVDDTWNPCTAPGLAFTGYFGEPIEGYQCPLEYRASYWPSGGPWSAVVPVSPPDGVLFPGRPQFRVPEQQGLPTNLVFERRLLGSASFSSVQLTSVNPTGTDLLFRDNTAGPCGQQVLRSVIVVQGQNRFYINRANVTWFSVAIDAGTYPLNELFGKISTAFANADTCLVETYQNRPPPATVRPQFIKNVKFEYLASDRVRASIVGPTNYDGYFEQPGTDAYFRVTTTSGTEYDQTPPNLASNIYPNLNTLLGFIPQPYDGPNFVTPSSLGQVAPAEPRWAPSGG